MRIAVAILVACLALTGCSRKPSFSAIAQTISQCQLAAYNLYAQASDRDRLSSAYLVTCLQARGLAPREICTARPSYAADPTCWGPRRP